MSLERLFYPKSIAVVGASPNSGGGKLPYYQVIKGAGFKGRIYPVNPAHREIDGQPVYQDLADLPETPDFVIAAVPVKSAYRTLEAAGARGVPFIHFYTSGFSETGDIKLEEAMLKLAKQNGTRIVGPNCLGVHSTEAGVGFMSEYLGADFTDPGNIAFVGQSGGIAQNFMRYSASIGLRINKAVSCGNQIDLSVGDYIDYFADDEKIQVIAFYLEGVKNGRAFLKILKKAAQKKPLAVLKGGATALGARAAVSHTGAIAGRHIVFSAAIKQCGCVQVETLEQLGNFCQLATSHNLPQGRRIGFVGPGGGASVLFTDAAAKKGFTMPILSQQTQERISEKISYVNTSTANPVDLGAFGLDFNIMAHSIKALDHDENIDIIVPYFLVEFFANFPLNELKEVTQIIIGVLPEIKKPVIFILDKVTQDQLGLDAARIQMFNQLRSAGLSVFSSLAEAMYTVDLFLQWQDASKRII